ncbi:MAG: hypothetical protein ACYCZG_17105 [Thiobacillus sp.]
MRIDFISLRDTYNELMSDVENAKRLDTDFYSEAFIKRTYIRSFFAMIEGVIFQLKQIALQANSEAKIFTDNEIQKLLEQEKYLTEDGVVKDRKIKTKLLTNLEFAILSVVKVLNLNYKIDKDSGWEQLGLAIKIRDRITHPKTTKSLLIDSDDMEILGRANSWFRDEAARLIVLIHANHDVV